MHTVKPLDIDLLEDSFAKFPVVATVEEHSIIGGFGSSVAEWLGSRPSGRSRLCRIGVEDKYIHGAGNQENARTLFGLTPAVIGDRLLNLLQE
jgi:transketolase